ncbi:MAG: type II toxin-antitoxin system PemK/MazF family toxin [Actinomycetota bacterium]|nr:type II toxin-antitoxin system PemK/MazF family toxin [Actinomycetota bacterium]
MSGAEARRGEVWFADVPGDKRRPVLVLTRDPMGRLLHSVICAPVTTNVRGLATEIPLGKDAGVVRRSVANFDNVFLLARARLVRRLGRASGETMRGACKALAVATGCDGPQPAEPRRRPSG